MEIRSGLQYGISRFRRVLVWALIGAAGLVLGTALPAHANCNLIPAAVRELPSEQGLVSQAVALPGDTVTVRVDLACDAATAGFSRPAANNIVTLTFEPPDPLSQTTEVVVDPGPTGCDPLSDNPCVGVANCGDDPDARCDTLLFVVPDTGLTGPARIWVETPTGEPLAEIATLFEPTLSCEDRVPEEVFQRFTVLPPLNAFTDGTQTLLATLDGGNNLLIPLDFTAVIAGTAGDAVARIVKGTASVPAFDEGGPNLQAPEHAVRAFTTTGRPIPPILEPSQGGETLFGSVDAEQSVLRIAHLLPDGSKLHNFTGRLGNGEAIEIVGAELANGPACPLASLQSSTDTVVCSEDESIDGEDLNGDLDEGDQVPQILDLATGNVVPTGLNVTPVTASPIRIPIRTEGGLSAFLQSEFRKGSAGVMGDINGDGDAIDSILRVISNDGTDLTELVGRLWTADSDPRVSATQAVVDGGLVYFRTRESDEVSPETEIAALRHTGTPPDTATYLGGTSADGRYLAFSSGSDNILPSGEDTNGTSDVFVRDRQTGAVVRASVDSDGNQVDEASGKAVISANGRFVAFSSVAPDLVAGDGNSFGDVFVHDLQTGVTERVSIATGGGEGSGSSFTPSISGDGSVVAFVSEASDLVSGDTGYRDIFVHDRQTGTTERVSEPTGGGQAHGDSDNPAISRDGRFVAFQSNANDLTTGDVSAHDIFVHNRETGVTERVSLSSQTTGFGSSAPSISDDGRFVVFQSTANDLVPGDTLGFIDVFVFDRKWGATERVSVGRNGEEANGNSYAAAPGPAISADGRYVLFDSSGWNLLWEPSLYRQVFLRDRRTGSTMLVSMNRYGTQPGNEDSFAATVTPDGRIVAFRSQADDLDYLGLGGVNPWTDGYVWEPGDWDVWGPATSINDADTDLLDTVLRVLDTTTTPPSLQTEAEVAASEVVVALERALLITPEVDEGGTDLTDDGDPFDGAAQLYDAASSPPLVNLFTPANRVALSAPEVVTDQVACLSIPEVQFGDDLNGDGDPDDDVLGGGLVANLLPPTQALPTVVPMALEALAALGTRCVFLLPEAAQGAGGTDYNGDGDMDDLVVQAWDAATDSFPLDSGSGYLPPAAAEFVVGAHKDVVAFRTCEADEGAGGTDLNQDGDEFDCVLQYVDLSQTPPGVVNTGYAAEICDFDGCDPFFEPYRVRENMIAFVTTEAAQSGPDTGRQLDGSIGGVGCGPLSKLEQCDLTGDGDNYDTVITVVSLGSGKGQTFEVDAEDPGAENPFPKTVVDKTVLSLRSPDGQSKIVGDVDEDGTLDVSTTTADNCQEDPNAEQADGDDDQLGDAECDDSTNTVLPGEGLLCDVDLDGDIDQVDLDIIIADSGMEARESDPRDADGDGWVEAVDDVEFCTSATAIVEIDIMPDSATNLINLRSPGVVPVAILGSFDVDVTAVDVTTLAFGPAGAAPAHSVGGHPEDVNGDGFTDLVSHYLIQETGIAFGDKRACVQGEIAGLMFSGCDAIKTKVPTSYCGTGVELALLLPLLAALRRRRRG